MPKLHPAQFQFVVTMRVKKGTRPTRSQVRSEVENWIKNGPTLKGWKFSVIIWDRGQKRIVTELDDSPRGEVLRSILQRGLQRATFRINKMGGG